MDELFVIIVFITVCVGTGLILGMQFEWNQHKQYCDCPECKKWRKDRAAEGNKKESV